MNYEVEPQDGHYLVTVTSSAGVQVRVVTKDKECSCGRPRCAHVRAVRDYLLAGGERAVCVESAQTEAVACLFSECPVCGGPVVYGKFPWSDAGVWHCLDSGHYWLWRGEQGDGAIRKFMCGEGAERWNKLLKSTGRVGSRSSCPTSVTR